MELEAKDQGEPPKFSRVPLKIIVLDVDDLNPQFSHRYYTAKSIKVSQPVIFIFPFLSSLSHIRDLPVDC